MHPRRPHTQHAQAPAPLAQHADWAGILLSALCGVHCLLPVLVPWMALAGFGAVVFSPDYEPWLKLSAIALVGVILTAGFLRHRRAQPALIGLLGLAAMLLASKVPHALEPLMVGAAATLLCLAHYRNWRHLNAALRQR